MRVLVRLLLPAQQQVSIVVWARRLGGAVPRLGRLDAREDVRVGEAEVGVDDDRAVTTSAELARDIDRQRGLADPTLAGCHGEDLRASSALLRLLRVLSHGFVPRAMRA